MIDFIFALLFAAILSTFAFVAGKEVGWEQRHRNEVVCETLLDGSINCIPAKRVKKEQP